MSVELQFIIMIDAPVAIEQLLKQLQLTLADSVKVSPHSFDWRDNWIQLWRNNDYDATLANDPDDGYLYYPYRIEVSPKNEQITLEKQLETARQLRHELTTLGYRFEICADFEASL